MTSTNSDSVAPLALVVDDEDDQRELLQTILERAGCRTLTANSGADALALAEIAALDIIFLDLLIPDIDGWQLSLIFQEKFPQCPIIISSVLDRARYPEAAGFLPKPFSGDQVRSLLRALLPSAASQ